MVGTPVTYAPIATNEMYVTFKMRANPYCRLRPTTSKPLMHPSAMRLRIVFSMSGHPSPGDKDALRPEQQDDNEDAEGDRLVPSSRDVASGDLLHDSHHERTD